MNMLHWIEAEDRRGLPTWLRYVACSHWGMILTAEQIRWHFFQGVGRSIVTGAATT